MGCDPGPSYQDIMEAERREREERANEKRYTSRDITLTVIHAKLSEAYRVLSRAQSALRAAKRMNKSQTPFQLGRVDEAIGNVESAKRRTKKLERVRDEEQERSRR